jgi:hypothetical protein
MTIRQETHEDEFSLVARGLRLDSRGRLTIGKALPDMGTDIQFDVYRNPSGQIILDPQVVVPLREAWLYRSAEALAAVQRGLAEADEGNTVSLGSFAPHAADE